MCPWVLGSFRFEVPALVHAWDICEVSPRLDADDPVEFEKQLDYSLSYRLGSLAASGLWVGSFCILSG